MFNLGAPLLFVSILYALSYVISHVLDVRKPVNKLSVSGKGEKVARFAKSSLM